MFKFTKKFFTTLLMISGILFALICVHIFGKKFVTPEKAAEIIPWIQFIEAILVALMSILTIKLIHIMLIKPIEEKRETKFPGIVKDSIGIVVLCIGSIFIIRDIYGESVFGILSLLAGSGVIIGIASRSFLEEVICGLVMDFQNDFKAGDWLKLSDGSVAKIKKMKLTCVDLVMPDKTILHMNNTKITGSSIINLSGQYDPFILNINVVLDQNVCIGKVRKILLDAMGRIENVDKKRIIVIVERVKSNGIVFGIYFKIINKGDWIESRHNIMNVIIETLKTNNIKVKEIFGDFEIKHFDKTA